MLEKVPVIQLQYDSCIVYESYLEERRFNPSPKIDNLIRDNSYNGYMSPKTRTKCIKMLSIWINSFKQNYKAIKEVEKTAYIGFLTLTLGNVKTQPITDADVKRNMLMRYIEELKHNYGLEHYFWRAEPQKNGKIHFHLLIDRFIDKVELRDRWNKYLDKYECIDYSRLKSGIAQSIKVHKLESKIDAAAYVLKYCTKSPKKDDSGKLQFFDEDGNKLKEERKIKGRIWGSSDGIKELRPFSEYLHPADTEVKKLVDKYDVVDITEGVTFIRGFKLSKVRQLIPNLYAKAKEFYKQQILELYLGCEITEPVPVQDFYRVLEDNRINEEELFNPIQLKLDLRHYERWERIGTM